MNKVITINSNRLEKSIMVKDILRKKLTKEGYIVSDTIKANTELVIAIGGDGCFLQTIHKFNFVDIPVLGVNTGHLGFLAELSPEQIDFFIKAYKNNEYFIQSVSPIEAKINTKYKSIDITAINEIVIKNVKSKTFVTFSFSQRTIRIYRFSFPIRNIPHAGKPKGRHPTVQISRSLHSCIFRLLLHLYKCFVLFFL